jgi:hypothetical protein
MAACIRATKLLLACLVFLLTTGCEHRSATVASAQTSKPSSAQPPMLMVAPRTMQTFHSTPPAIQFDYPACWNCCKAKTGTFAITGPPADSKCSPSICLDIPKLPWHIPGMIPIGLVARGYVDDLRTNQIHDAVVQEQVPVTVCGTPARRVTCVGHVNGKPSIDVAVIMLHADHVYILSADSDDAGRTAARQTLDDVVSSLKWTK